MYGHQLRVGPHNCNLVRNMDSFERTVRDYAKNDRPGVIENASVEHALVLIRILFETAIRHKEEVRIVSGRLFKSFYEELVDTARRALDYGVQFSVLVLTSKRQLEGNEFAKLITDHDNGSIAVIEDGDERLPHFVIVGDRRYRIEIDDERKIAVASFNDDTITPMLLEFYSRLECRASAVA